MRSKAFLRSALFLFLMGLLLVACEPEEDNSINPFNLPPTVEGNWTLKNTTGVENGVDHNFPNNQVRWQFKPPSGQVKIVNNNFGGGIFDGPGTGEYFYEVRKKSGNQYLFILGFEYGQITELRDSSMVVDQRYGMDTSFADPYILTFER